MALVAQWIEHQTSNLGVAGSSPAGGTFSNNSQSKMDGLFFSEHETRNSTFLICRDFYLLSMNIKLCD